MQAKRATLIACLCLFGAQPTLRADTTDDLVVRDSKARPAPNAAATGGQPLVLKLPKLDPHAWRPIIVKAAAAEAIPADILERLIWRESGNFPYAVSRAGAQGIAQFMPRTAAQRDLADPFSPQAAIPAAAAYLHDLKRRFGDLNLALAAYNAGAGRVSDFLAGRSNLPQETIAYVHAIAHVDVVAAYGPIRSANTSLVSHSTKSPLATPQARPPALSEAALCMQISTAEHPCRVEKLY